MAENPESKIWKASIDSSGSVRLPVELRRLLEIRPGSGQTWSRDESGIHLPTGDKALKDTEDHFSSFESPEAGRSEAIWPIPNRPILPTWPIKHVGCQPPFLATNTAE